MKLKLKIFRKVEEQEPMALDSTFAIDSLEVRLIKSFDKWPTIET